MVVRAVIYALSTSLTLTSKALRAAIVRAKQSVSRETTLAYVMVGGALVKCPLATSCALRQHMGHPPVKGWFMVDFHQFCVFPSFNRVDLKVA